MNHALRVRTLRAGMKAQGIEALLVTHLPDVRYLCGFTGSNAALAITLRRATLFTDGRYLVQAREETQAARVVIAKGSVGLEASAFLEGAAANAAFDPEETSVAELTRLRMGISGKRRRTFFQPLASPLVSALRQLKDEDELRLMQEAAMLGCRIFESVLPHLEPGVPEVEIAADLEFFARSLGAEGMSFDTIIASGPRSSLPHGRATTAPLPRNGFVTMDFGVILSGYCSDMTRTVYLGKASKRERSAYDAVLEAQQAGVAKVAAGVTCGDVDEAARSVLRKAGLDRYFTHSTGHGVGLEIHEAPRLAAAQTTVLKRGMVVTVEPGIYIPGEFGIRIEDTVAVINGGSTQFTATTKAWIEL